MSDSLVRNQPSALTASGEEWQAIREQAATLIKSGFLPRAVNTPEKAIAIMLAGRELGLPPMRSIRAIAIVDGKPTLSAETMLALAYQRVPGLKVEVLTNAGGAVVKGSRPGGPPVEVAFTRSNAEAAGLLGKDNWRKYPEAMYRARAISAWCRVVCPDAILGAYTPEELEPAVRPAPAPLTDLLTGEVVDDPRPTQEEPQEATAYAPDGPVDADPPMPEAEVQRAADPLISEPQRRRLYAMGKAAQATQNWDNDRLAEVMTALLKKYGYSSTKDIRRSDYDAIGAEVESWK